jgi:predicted outer membrane repeat protein
MPEVVLPLPLEIRSRNFPAPCEFFFSSMKNLAAFLLSFALATAVLHAVDGALSFTPSSSQYVEVPDFHNLNITGEVTIEFWAYTNTVGTHSAFMLEADDLTNRCQMHTAYPDGKTYWDFGDINSNGRTSVTTPNDSIGVWTHWAMVSSKLNNHKTIYRNGSSDTFTIGATTSVFNNIVAKSLRIGGTTGTFFDGRIDEFRVWNKELSQREIAALKGLKLSGNEPGLLLYYKFDEINGNTAINSATALGAAWNGTLVNAPMRVAGCSTPYSVTNTHNDGPGSLRQAAADAEAGNSPALITFTPELDNQTIILNSQIVVSASSGVTLDATTLPNGLTIGGGPGSGRFLALKPKCRMSLHGLNFINGNRDAAPNSIESGGAILNVGGGLLLYRCAFTGNKASGGGRGGAIFSAIGATYETYAGHEFTVIESPFLALTQCTFSGNAAGDYGGAIYIDSDDEVTLTQCSFSENSAHGTPSNPSIPGDNGGYGGYGGAIYHDGRSMTLVECNFANNSVSPNGYYGGGGAIYNTSVVTLSKCVLSGNSIINGIAADGGAIYSAYRSNTILSQCALSGNSSDNEGGAIYSAGSLNVTYSTLSGNSTDGTYGGFGGAIYCNGNLLLKHSTLTGNSTNGGYGGSGGAIYSSGGFSLSHCTLSANMAYLGAGYGGNGGAIACRYAIFTNSIVSGNTAPSGPDIFNTGTIFDRGVNFIGDLTGSGLTASSTLLTGDALLAPLANYGGLTQTMALLPGSPARNAAAVLAPATTTDQRDFPILDKPDIGAYEAGTLSSNYNAYIWESLPTLGSGLTSDPLHASTTDYDGDGQSNGDEFNTLTDPTSGASFFHATSAMAGADFVISFPTATGRSYTLQRSADLAPNSWITNGLPAAKLGNGTVRSFTVPANTPGRCFFRVLCGPSFGGSPE